FGVLFGAPLYFSFVDNWLHHSIGVPVRPDPNAAVSAVMFYRVMLPLIVQAALVAAPALWGMNQAKSVEKLSPWLRVILWTASVATLVAMTVREPQFWVFLAPHFLNTYVRTGMWLAYGTHILQFVIYWPIAYVATSAIERYWHQPAST